MLLLGAPPKAEKLPADWPPLPDFKTWIDYPKWWQDYLDEGVTDDASPLWAEIADCDSDSEEERHAKNAMWGLNAQGGAHGLFRGAQEITGTYAWRPEDHPEWERAFHATADLRDRLKKIIKHRHVRLELSWDPRLVENRAADYGVSPEAIGFTGRERLLILATFPPPTHFRSAAKLLLECAWRAPNGAVEGRAIRDSTITTLKIARQLERPHRTIIESLVSISIRRLAYESLLRALDEVVLAEQQIDKLYLWLGRWDRDEIRGVPSAPEDLVFLLDLLQFLYADGHGRFSRPPKPNETRVEKFAKYLSTAHKYMPGSSPEPLDIRKEIGKYDPLEGVGQAVGLHRQLQKCAGCNPACEVLRRSHELVAAFRADALNHVVLRQWIAQGVGIRHALAGGTEALRRGVRVVLGLHRQRIRTGKWPTSLRGLSTMSRGWRDDPMWDGEFVYRVERGKPLLYSVGLNGKDDGGLHHQRWGLNDAGDGSVSGDYVIWPIVE